jgi:hypothetical protein
MAFPMLIIISVTCATIGILAREQGMKSLSLVAFTTAGIAGAITILLGLNPNFFSSIKKSFASWFLVGSTFAIIAFLANGCGTEYGPAAIFFATVAALAIIEAVGQGCYPHNIRVNGMLSITLNLIIYIPLTWIIVGGSGALLTMFTSPVADQIANTPLKEAQSVGDFWEITALALRNGAIRMNGNISFPHLVLVLHIFYNLLYKIIRSFGKIFIVATIGAVIMTTAWIKSRPQTLFELKAYVMIALSLIILGTLAQSIRKHWSIPAITTR